MDVVIKNVGKIFQKERALDGVSLDIEGGMFGLLGPNGAGKTTLMRILSTQLLPTSGQVMIGGVDVTREPALVRHRLGYLPQEFGFFGNLTANQMLDYIAVMKNIPPFKRRSAIHDVLEQVNLLHVANRRIAGFSGGMKRRLGIAQALLGNPGLIIVDEPTAGLDPEERIRMRNLLAYLSQNRTVILSTHIVGDVEATCTRMAILKTGRILFHGTPLEITKAAQNQVWTLLIPLEEFDSVARRYRVMASRTVGHQAEVRVLSDHSPLGQGTPAEPTVEDGYLLLAHGPESQGYPSRGASHG